MQRHTNRMCSESLDGRHTKIVNSAGWVTCRDSCGYGRRATEKELKRVANRQRIELQSGQWNSRADVKLARQGSRKNPNGVIYGNWIVKMAIFMSVLAVIVSIALVKVLI